MTARARRGAGWLAAAFATIGLAGAVVLPARGQPPAAPGRMTELVLDASGSMGARLGDGVVKLDAARKAVDTLLARLPDTAVVALRAYGHQSTTDKHDCRDTQLLAPFGALGARRDALRGAATALAARGYTPITLALTEAARDFPAGHAGEAVIVLVSDGRETCRGDPCALARELARQNARLVVHTVGFGVDATARQQLQCVAKAAGGRYFDATNADDLAASLGKAVETVRTVVVEKKGPGWLKVEGADVTGNEVTRADSAEVVGRLGHTNSTLKLEAGVYNVTVAKSVWKSVEIEAGKTTVLRPAKLQVLHASLRGHPVVDRETREEQALPSSTQAVVALMPGDYDVMFGPLAWPVSLQPGETLRLDPGVVEVKGAGLRGHAIRTPAGTEVARPSQSGSIVPLPPGAYQIDLGGAPVAFTVAAGERVVFEVR